MSERSDLIEERDAEREAAKLGAVGVVPQALEGVQHDDPAAAIAEGIRRLSIIRDEMRDLVEVEADILAELDRAFEALKNGAA